jgi:di/tricarboxylate transporter
MTLEIIITLIIILIGLILFIKEYFSVDTTAIIIMSLLIITGILTPQEGFAGFNNTATITVACMFVLSHAVFKTGILDGFGDLLIKISKRSNYLSVVMLVSFATILSAFINVTAIVAMFIPVVLKISDKTKLSPGKYLMPLSFGALLGGVCTLTGTSTNILVSSIAESHGLNAFKMFEFTKAGVWITAIGLIYLFSLGYLLLPNRKNKTTKLKDEITKYITQIRVKSTSTSIGKVLEKSNLMLQYNAQILQINQENQPITPHPNYVLNDKDILTISISPEDLKELRENSNYYINTEYNFSLEKINTQYQKIVEILIPPGSQLLDIPITSFSKKYDSLIIARRSNKYLQIGNIEDNFLNSGDILLLMADEDSLKELMDGNDIVILSEEVKREQKSKFKIFLVLAIIISVIGAAALGLTSIVISAMLGSLSLIIFKILDPQEAYEAVEWKVIFMLAGVLSMGAAIEKTGAAFQIGQFVQHQFGTLNPQIILLIIIFITILLTNFMSNNATAALMAPIVIGIASALGLSEKPFLLGIMFAASLSFITPMGYQTNAIIYTPGNYKFMDYVKVGTPLNILTGILTAYIIPYYFPF